MEELKMLYIAPEAELILFMPVEGIASSFWDLQTASEENGSGPGINVDQGDSEDDGEEDPLGF